MPLPRRRHLPRRAVLAVAVVLGALAPVLPISGTDAAVAAPVISLPTPSRATVTARAGAVDVAWTSSQHAHRWKVLAFADGRYLGQRTFAGTARSGRVGHIPPGTNAMAWVVAITAEGWWGTMVPTASVRIPRDVACPATTGTCVHINGRAVRSATTGVGLGLLHGATSATNPDRVKALSPRHWRVSAFNAETFRLARASGASVTVLLSDPWSWHTMQPTGRVSSPWADFELYRWWLGMVVQWHLAQGLVPDRWEVQNEPSAHLFDAAHPPTTKLLVEQHAVATEVIRSYLPKAEIVGFSASPYLTGHGVTDVQAFTSLAASRRAGLGALAWHENTGACASCDGGPASVRQHLDDARAALVAAGMAGLPIDITEFAAPYEQLQPGAIVGYLSALAEGGVRYAGTACWERPGRGGVVTSSCFDQPGTLDGLLLPDGTTPTDAWWTYAAYAQLSAKGTKLVATSVDDPVTSALASMTTTSLRALIGRHSGCTAADAPCPGGTTPGKPEEITARVTFPSAGQWEVIVSRVASSSGAAKAPIVVKRTLVQAKAAALTVGRFRVADGEVLQVQAIRR